MTLVKHANRYWIGKPSEVWGITDYLNTYVRVAVANAQQFAATSGLVYNAALRCWMLAPTRTSPDMQLANWDQVLGSFTEVRPPQRAGRFLRHKGPGEWGIKSLYTITGTNSFSVFVQRVQNKEYELDEYVTVGLHDPAVAEWKWKFYRNGVIEILESGTVVESRMMLGNAEQWADATEIRLDFYTLANGNMLIACPLWQEPLLTERRITTDAYVMINGSGGQALVGFLRQQFATGGTATLNSMSHRTNGESRFESPGLRVFPDPPGGCSVTVTDTEWVDGLFKPTLTWVGDGDLPVMVQLLEFDWASEFAEPDDDAWYEVTQWVASAEESLRQDLHSREVRVSLLFKDADEVDAFAALWTDAVENPQAPQVAFRHQVYVTGEVLPSVDRVGVLRVSDEAHDDHTTLTATAYSRLAAYTDTDATILPAPAGLAALGFWQAALAVLGLHPSYVTTTDPDAMADPGWNYDRQEYGRGKRAGEYLRELAAARGYVLDDREGMSIAIREREPSDAAVLTLDTDNPEERSEGLSVLTRTAETTEYANTVEVLYETAAGIPRIARAWCEEMVWTDRRVVARVVEMRDKTLSAVDHARRELESLLLRTEKLTISLPSYGLNQLWPGETRVLLRTTEPFAIGSPADNEYTVTDVRYNLEGGEGYITADVTVTRSDVLPGLTILTEDAFYPSGAVRNDSGVTRVGGMAVRRPRAARAGDHARFGVGVGR